MKLVCPKKQTDGFGSQFQNIISTIVCCGIRGFEYIHRPIGSAEHNYDNDSKYINTLNETINIDKNIRIVSDITDKKTLKTGNFKGYFDKNFEKCINSQTLADYKIQYMKNKLDNSKFFPDNKFNISIHIRVFNTHDLQKCYKFRFKNDGPGQQIKTAIKLMNKLQKQYTNKHIIFHIFSQGKEQNFKIFKNNFTNVRLHLDEPVEITFHKMVISDVLLINKSSISYTAALLTNAQVYYKPFWHATGKKWIAY